MLRNSRHHLLSRWQAVATSSTKRQIAVKRGFASLEANSASTATSSTTPALASRGQRIAAYVAAGATAGAFTCYRPDELIDQDPYNVSSTVLAILAHRAVVTTMTRGMALPLIGSIVVGEFLGNGFRHTRRQFFSITVSDQERHQLLDEVAQIAHLETNELLEKDLLDTFENSISNILLQAKTRWVHLSDSIYLNADENDDDANRKRRYSSRKIPKHMSTEDLKIAIHNMSAKTGVTGEDNEKEALLQVLSVADINNNGVITFHDFSRALLLLEFAKRDNTNAKAELYFRAIDLHNNGAIDEQELLHFCQRLYALGGIPHKDRTTPHWSGLYERPATPEEICSSWMNRFDLNHDGLISREEFAKMAEEIDFGPSFLFTKYFDRTPE
eukprot:CAMPEP_0113614606 /NCGR_PEP_ID=MMETSP0017_2-20120614/7259_1 /TAXON_ID=2856 /ORGANISM="Cylindrotheca closterium" /LENGTH=385 /DNA_ID=CAMNT_0000523791 /DNA_START=79 /DNA_END=1236 /DNA_ORIENTATION=+ /assembly_acc=CAM_ASM_000147